MKRSIVYVLGILFLLSVICEGQVNIATEVRNLKSKNIDKKLKSIERLAKSRNKDAVDQLVSHFKVEKSTMTKIKILESFSYCHNKDTIQETINVINTEENPDIRFAAVYSLGYAKDPSVVPVLIKIFLDDNEDLSIRLQAASSLVNYTPTEEIYQTFMKGLDNPNVKIKIQSIVSLSQSYGSVYPDKVIPVLQKLKDDTDPKIRQTAKQYLEFLGVTINE